MAKLKENTVITGKNGEPFVLLAGDDVPRWASKQVGDHLVDKVRSSSSSGGDNGGSDGGGSDEPPRGGEGATEEAWRAYAEGLEIDVPDDAGRDDIIALVDASK